MKARHKVAAPATAAAIFSLYLMVANRYSTHGGIPCKYPEIIKHSFGHDFGV